MPLPIGIAGSVMIAEEALGPMITLAVWLALIFIPAVRAKLNFVEWLACSGCLLVLQLLLDLHTRHLGDLVIAGAHAVALLVLAVRWIRRRRR